MWGDDMSIKATVSVKPITITTRVQVSSTDVNGGAVSPGDSAAGSADVTVPTIDVNGGPGKPEDVTGKTLIRMAKKADFPSLGETDRLYIDETDGVVYLWSDADLTYTPIASDWHQIDTINGGNA